MYIKCLFYPDHYLKFLLWNKSWKFHSLYIMNSYVSFCKRIQIIIFFFFFKNKPKSPRYFVNTKYLERCHWGILELPKLFFYFLVYLNFLNDTQYTCFECYTFLILWLKICDYFNLIFWQEECRGAVSWSTTIILAQLPPKSNSNFR